MKNIHLLVVAILLVANALAAGIYIGYSIPINCMMKGLP